MMKEQWENGKIYIVPLQDHLFARGRVNSERLHSLRNGFCEFCRERNRAAGIDVERAATGYRELYAMMEKVSAGQRPVDGVLTEVVRHLFRYPELLSYYDQWLKADTEIQAMLYRAGKEIRPEADIGQHVDHQRSSWDLFFRAAVSYGEMAEHNDFIKPILYHEIFGPRLQEWVIDEMQERVLADFPKDLALELFYHAFGHDPQREASYRNLGQEGLSPEYVFVETKRCVEGCAGKAAVYAGIGMDGPHYVPGGMVPVISDPDSVFEACIRAMDAGASGLLASREYREMTLPTLRAFGRAVRVLG